MFYPDIERRVDYPTKTDGSYYVYGHYRAEITEDCQSRCVYCDITVQEHGGEGMQLDHFKPRELFNHLENDPNNLVLACPGCNRLKSSHWPQEESIGLNGFLDPFAKNRISWYQICQGGEIGHTNSATAFKIEKLHLNRPARVQIRRKRLLEARIHVIDIALGIKIDELNKKLQLDLFDHEEVRALSSEIKLFKELVDVLRQK